MTLLNQKAVLAAKIETTPGTAETLAAADGAMNCYEVNLVPEIAKTPREGQGGLGNLSSITEGHRGRVTFSTDMPWDGTLTEPFWADTLLPACSYVKSTNTFTPRSEAPGSNTKTLTLGLYVDGTRHLLRGAVGTFSLVLEAGKRTIFNWDFTGIWQAPTDIALIAPTYPTTDVLCRYGDGVTTWAGVSLIAKQITFNANNQIYLREGSSASNPTGYIAGCITGRRPTVTVDPEAKLVSVQNRYQQFIDNTIGALVFEVKGPGTSKIVFTAPAASMENIQPGNREKLRIDTIDFLCGQNGSTQDQDMQIVFTP
jgi:hypothetical protein